MSDGPAVLIADDEPLLRRLMRRVLEAEGLVIHEAADGAEALAVLGAARPAADVAVIDLGLPPWGGVETLERLLAAQPGLRVVLTSGLPPDARADAALRREGGLFLQKPFPPDGLRRAVKDTGRGRAG